MIGVFLEKSGYKPFLLKESPDGRAEDQRNALKGAAQILLDGSWRLG